VGDSLALGVHWIYDTEEIVRDYGRVTNLIDPSPELYHPNRKKENSHTTVIKRLFYLSLLLTGASSILKTFIIGGKHFLKTTMATLTRQPEVLSGIIHWARTGRKPDLHPAILLEHPG